jgi:hypothetical protein
MEDIVLTEMSMKTILQRLPLSQHVLLSFLGGSFGMGINMLVRILVRSIKFPDMFCLFFHNMFGMGVSEIEWDFVGFTTP